MVKTLRTLCSLTLPLFAALAAAAQTVNTAQAVVLEGLRSSAGAGSFKAAQYAPDGSLILLYDQGDGLRLLKTDASAQTLLAQAQQGGAGDAGVSLALDPSGNICVAGTSTSGALRGTPGAVYPGPADSSVNSFVARFDSSLHLLSLTFLGAGHTAVAGVACTGDAVFVTGVTYSAAFPVTASGIQQHPAAGSNGNGFVERFSPYGTALGYATYLTGVGGDTLPAAIVADPADRAYITGETSASGFPTTAALQPRMLGSISGFLAQLTPAGDGFGFSTFIAGSGLTSLALDSSTHTLLLGGNVAIGQFPIATVTSPLANTPYQTLLRLTQDGQSVPQSILLVPGSASFVSPGPGGTAWVSGSLGTPLFPGPAAPYSPLGDSFLLHIDASGVIDQTLRFGGLPVANASYASLVSTVGAPAVSSDGASATLPGTLSASASGSLLATQRFDVPLVAAPSSVLPGAARDLLPSTCTGASQCSGSAGLLAQIATSATAASLSLSSDDIASLTLRNSGSAGATGIVVTASGGYTTATDCSSTLPPSAQCTVALTGAGPGTISISAANAAPITAPLPASATPPEPLALSTPELDFGIVAAGSPVSRTVIVRNLSTAPQTFASVLDGGPAAPPYTLAETAGTCSGTTSAHTLAPNSTCTVTLTLSAEDTLSSDGPVHAAWKLGARDLAITGITEAAALTLSAAEIDFGVQFTGSTPHLPRYLYLSNSSGASLPHTAVSLPANSPFTVADGCPSSLQPHSVCQLKLAYNGIAAPSDDSTTLILDNGLTVLVTGETLSPPTTAASIADPNLTVSPSTLSFATPVVVTGISSATQTVTVANTGASALPLTVALTGDFKMTNGCGTLLNAGASCSIVLQFAPSQPGVRDGLLSITPATSFAPTLVALSGTSAGLLPPNNGNLDLGQTLIGEPAIFWYRLQSPLTTLTAATGAPFAVALVEDTGTGHGTLPASAFAPTATSSCASCWLGVLFLPQTSGAATATLTLSTTTGGNPYQLALTGTGLAVQGLLLTPTTADLGTVPVNSASAPLSFTLANLLTPATAISIQSITASGDFRIVSSPGTLDGCSGALSSTASCSLQLAFAPTATGPRSGTLTVATSSGAATASLTGSAVPDPGLALDPMAIEFTNGPGPTATQAALTLTNTGSAPLSLGTITALNASFATAGACASLAPGASCSLTVTFTPGEAEATGALSIPVSTTLNGQTVSTTYTVPLTGSYTTSDVGLLLLPAEADFGAQPTGSLGQTRQFTLVNTSAANQTISLSVPRQFPLAAPLACDSLAPGASCTFSVSFLPETGGALTGSLLATATAPGSGAASQAIGYLLGYGIAPGSLTISGQQIPGGPVSFGDVPSGQSKQQTLTLTNSSSAPVTIRRIVSAPPFLATSNCGATLSPGASCNVTVTYAPVYELAASATSLTPRADTETLVIQSDAASSPDLIDLTGTATPVLSGSPANSAAIASYTLSEGALTFPNTQVGNLSATQTLTLVNNGTTTLSVTGVSPPTDFTATSHCTTLLPGDSCTLDVVFAPGAAISTAVRAGTLEIQSNAATALEFVSLLGISTPAPLLLSPQSLSFGTVEVGSSDQLQVTATNTASLPIPFAQATATGDFSVATGACPAPGGSLPAGQSCAFTVTFNPSTTGTRTGTLKVATQATQQPLTVFLSGIGATARLQVTPGALPFGSISVGAPAVQTLTLVNIGALPLNSLAATVTGPNAADFALTTPCSQIALLPGGRCTVGITFTPGATGARSATLTYASSDPSGPVIIPLTGTGTQAGGFTLTVNGGTIGTAAVSAGTSANYALTLTPQSGYNGAVALTCAPVAAGPYAACSLLSSQLNLESGAQNATATITTINGAASSGLLSPIGVLFLAPLTLFLRRRYNSGLQQLCVLSLFFFGTALCLALTACGTANGLHLTPKGAYQYRVTANSTSGIGITSSVTLNLIVQ